MRIQRFGQDRINELTKALIGLSDNDYYWHIMDFLFEKENLRQPLNQIQNQLLATEVFDAQVNNGGFDQFYYNYHLEYIDDAIEGLKNFGSEDFARIARTSKEIYLRDKQTFTDRRNPAFEALEEEYYGLQSYMDRKIAYIKDNFELVIKDNK